MDAETINDTLPEIHWKTDFDAYRALRWFSPTAVKLIRACFDNGATAQSLSKRCEGRSAELARAAIRHMASHPDTGLVRWLDNGGWDWEKSLEEEALPNKEVSR